MDVSWKELDRLRTELGDTFFHLDLDVFRRNIEDFASEFRAHYPRTTIGYSYKTNYVPRLARIADELGCYAEVVSGMEYELARAVGAPADRIIFNGPFKPAAELEVALRAGSVCNLDGPEELLVVERLAAREPAVRMVVGLRCNLDLGTGRVSRFGFDADGPELADAIARLRRIRGVELAGLHVHASTGERSVESYALRTKRMLELTSEHFPTEPRFLNIGGGYFSRMAPAMRAQFAGEVPTFRDYAGAVAAQVRAHYGDGRGPELIVEPGTAITADVMSLVAAVVGVKRVRGRTVVLVAGSVHNIKPTGHGKAVPLTVVRQNPASSDTAFDVVGYTCMEHDVLAEQVRGTPEPGDFAVFDNVGAYTVVMQPPFIRPAPPIVALDPSSGLPEFLRRGETMSDLFSTYVL